MATLVFKVKTTIKTFSVGTMVSEKIVQYKNGPISTTDPVNDLKQKINLPGMCSEIQTQTSVVAGSLCPMMLGQH